MGGKKQAMNCKKQTNILFSMGVGARTRRQRKGRPCLVYEHILDTPAGLVFLPAIPATQTTPRKNA